MANDLKPCPFCQAHLIEAPALSTRNNRVMVHPNFDEGSRCPASSVVVHTGQTVSVERWNSRALHALPADLAGLVEKLQIMGDETRRYRLHRNHCRTAREAASALEALAGRQVADRAGAAVAEFLSQWNAAQEEGYAIHGSYFSKLENLPDYVKAALTAAPPAPQAAEEHPDDAAVDRFAAAMKAKMKWEREHRGRSGWDDPEVCTPEYLARLLVEHLTKGNPGTFEDVANFCMMLHQRGCHPAVLAEAFSTPPASGKVEAELSQRLREAAEEECSLTQDAYHADLLNEAATTVAAMQAEIERLTRELSGYVQAAKDAGAIAQHNIARAVAAEAELAKLKTEQKVMLMAVLYHFGPDGALKVTTSVIEERDRALLKGETG